MKRIGFIISIVLWLMPILLGSFMFSKDEVVSTIFILITAGYVGDKSLQDAKKFYKWFKSNLR